MAPHIQKHNHSVLGCLQLKTIDKRKEIRILGSSGLLCKSCQQPIHLGAGPHLIFFFSYSIHDFMVGGMQESLIKNKNNECQRTNQYHGKEYSDLQKGTKTKPRKRVSHRIRPMAFIMTSAMLLFPLLCTFSSSVALLHPSPFFVKRLQLYRVYY